MSIKDRKKREKEQRKQSILDSAHQLFVEKGIEKTTMSDIAEASELAKGTLYLYFKSKNEIILTFYLIKLQDFKKYLEDNINADDTCLTKILAFYKLTYSFYKENPLYLIVENYWDYIDYKNSSYKKSATFKEIVALDTELYQEFVEMFYKGINKNEIRAIENPEQYLLATDVSLTGLIKFCISREKGIQRRYNFSSESVLDTFVEIIRNDLLAK